MQKQSKEAEEEAIKVLMQAWEESGQYRFKMRVGDIKMKQMSRVTRALANKVREKPDDDAARQKYQEARKRQLAFELQEYTERVKNYPTDLALRYELGKRLYLAGKTDDAIGAFQQAKSDPKHRASAHEYLGRCYMDKGWLDEAIETLREGVEAHKLSDDRQALELRYLLMNALAQSAESGKNLEHAKEAQQLGSAILRTDIKFRDIQERMNTIRELVTRLQG